MANNEHVRRRISRCMFVELSAMHSARNMLFYQFWHHATPHPSPARSMALQGVKANYSGTGPRHPLASPRIQREKGAHGPS